MATVILGGFLATSLADALAHRFAPLLDSLAVLREAAAGEVDRQRRGGEFVARPLPAVHGVGGHAMGVLKAWR